MCRTKNWDFVGTKDHSDAIKNFKQALDQMVADNEVTAAYANQLIRLMRAGLNQYAAAAGFGGSFDYVATGSGRPMRSRFDVERERSNATPLAFTNVQKKSDVEPAAVEPAAAAESKAPAASSEKPTRTAPPRPTGISPMRRAMTTRVSTMFSPTSELSGVPDRRR